MAGSIKERIDEVLQNRRRQLPIIDQQVARWERIQRLLGDLDEAMAGVRDQPASDALAATLLDVDVPELRRLAAEALAALAEVRARVSRHTVNIGVSGRARNGKSTLLQSLSGLDDGQIPTGRGQPVTAVRSRIFHSLTQRSARLTMHTEQSFLDDVIEPYHEQLGLLPAPQSIDEFAQYPYPVGDDPRAPGINDHPKLGPMLVRVRQMQQALASCRDLLSGEVRTVDLAEVRAWVAYPRGDHLAQDRRYLAVRDATLTCAFPVNDVMALGLVDLPGLGELVPRAEEHHLAGLRNDVDFVLVVKWPKDTNALWTAEDGASLQLIGLARGAAALRDFAAILINTGECSQTNIDALRGDISEHLNDQVDNKNYWVMSVDAANREAVRRDVLGALLDHLVVALPRMDAAVIEHAVTVCAVRRDRLAAELDRLLPGLRAIITPTPTELLITRAERLRSEVAASVQAWLDELRRQASDAYQDEEFYARVAAVQASVRDWVMDGFGQGVEEWIETALNGMRVRKASAPFATDALNGIRVEMARRFGAIDDLLLRRRTEFWAGLVAALGPRFGSLIEDGDPERGLRGLSKILGEAPEPCPVLSESLDFVLDVRLDYRTRVLPRLRSALDGLQAEPDDQDEGRMAALLTVPRTAEGAKELFDRISSLARQAAYEAGVILAEEPGMSAQALFAYGEQFEDTFVRSAASEAEFRRLAEAFKDQMWPEEPSGQGVATARVQRVRGLASAVRTELFAHDVVAR